MNRKLRIGYYDCDGFFPTTPGMKRAVRMAREGLQKLGHELVPFSPSRVDYMLETYVSVMQCDQGRYLLDALYVGSCCLFAFLSIPEAAETLALSRCLATARSKTSIPS